MLWFLPWGSILISILQSHSSDDLFHSNTIGHLFTWSIHIFISNPKLTSDHLAYWIDQHGFPKIILVLNILTLNPVIDAILHMCFFICYRVHITAALLSQQPQLNILSFLNSSSSTFFFSPSILSLSYFLEQPTSFCLHVKLLNHHLANIIQWPARQGLPRLAYFLSILQPDVSF